MSLVTELRRGAPTLIGSTLAIAMGVTSLSLYVGGVFYKDLESAIGLTRTQLGMGVFLMTVGLAIANPIVGRTMDRWGPRGPALASFAALALLYLASAVLMHSVATYLTLQFLLGLLTAASGPITFVRAVSSWFDTGRGLALGVLLTGIGISAAVTPPFVVAVIASHGWQAGFLALAAIAAAGMIPVALLVRVSNEIPADAVGGLHRSPVDAAPVPSQGHPPAATPPETPVLTAPELGVFASLLAAIAIMALSFAGMMSHFAPLLGDSGASPARVGALMGLVGISLTLSRPLIGWLLDRFFAPYIACAVCLICLAGFLVLWLIGPSAAALSAVAFGSGMGAEGDMLGYLVTRYFGLKRFGRLYGVQYAVFIIAAGISPLWMGISFDRTGSYRTTFIISMVLLAIAAGLFLRLPRYAQEVPIVADTGIRDLSGHRRQDA